MAAGLFIVTDIMIVHTHATFVVKWITINMSKYTEKEVAEAKARIRQIMGPPSRDLEGKEYNHVKLMLALLAPYEQTNNQHTWTDCYRVGDIEYHVTYWPGNNPPTIAEYLPEEI